MAKKSVSTKTKKNSSSVKKSGGKKSTAGTQKGIATKKSASKKVKKKAAVNPAKAGKKTTKKPVANAGAKRVKSMAAKTATVATRTKATKRTRKVAATDSVTTASREITESGTGASFAPTKRLSVETKSRPLPAGLQKAAAGEPTIQCPGDLSLPWKTGTVVNVNLSSKLGSISPTSSSPANVTFRERVCCPIELFAALEREHNPVVEFQTLQSPSMATIVRRPEITD